MSKIIIEIDDNNKDKYNEVLSEITAILEYNNIEYDLNSTGKNEHIKIS